MVDVRIDCVAGWVESMGQMSNSAADALPP